MAEKMLRGKQPLTIWRGVNGGAGGHLYRGGLLDPDIVDPDDRKRLVDEGFLDVVVRKGESFVLAEDSDTGDKGDPVTVGDNGLVPESEQGDNGTTNTPANPVSDPGAEAKQAEARSKLPVDGSAPHANAGEDVWIEYAVKQGLDRTEAAKAGKAELKKVLAK